MLCSLEERFQYFGRICSPNLSGCLVTIFWHVTPCTLQCKYQFLWRTCHRHLKDVSSRFLRKVFAYLPKYTASHFRTHLVCSRFMCLLQVMRNLNASFFLMFCHPEVFNTRINIQWYVKHKKTLLSLLLFYGNMFRFLQNHLFGIPQRILDIAK